MHLHVYRLIKYFDTIDVGSVYHEHSPILENHLGKFTLLDSLCNNPTKCPFISIREVNNLSDGLPHTVYSRMQIWHRVILAYDKSA